MCTPKPEAGKLMNLVVTLEQRFDCTPDGAVWTQTNFAYPFWRRYLDVFEQVRVVARVRSVDAPLQGSKRANGEGTHFLPLPNYQGPWNYLRQLPKLRSVLREAVGADDAVILRVPSPIAAGLETRLRQLQRPYGVEVVGDPYDVFRPSSVRHRLRPFFRWLFTRQLRRQCAGACAAAYVTREALQRRYPAAPAGLSTHYSSVELSDADFAAAPRVPPPAHSPLTLVFVGTLAQLYKAPDTLIEAFAACMYAGLDLRLSFIGDGAHRADLERRVSDLNLGDRVRFLGQLPSGKAVQDWLDRADLFILPSRQEGLPRAMIEAMARGLPCIGSTVGGIPELLPSEDLVPPGDVKALASKILEVARDPDRLARMSARNLATARQYREDLLQKRRVEFYSYLRDKTAAWLAAK
jgi:glycosyltransferase involved in cell wall biosynthesis